MKTTPLDYLLHDAALNRNRNPVAYQFCEMLKDHPVAPHFWPEWNLAELGAALPDLRCDELLPPVQRMCLFSPGNIGGGLYHRPTIVDAAEGMEEIGPAYAAWALDCVLVYKLDDANFDVIGIMRDVSGIRLLPELQLRFFRAPGGWAWRISGTGFVNPYIYGPSLADLPEAGAAGLEAAVDYLGNLVALYLGGYHAWLGQAGDWAYREPVPAKAKTGKDGKTKKFYRIAGLGYRTFVPAGANGENIEENQVRAAPAAG